MKNKAVKIGIIASVLPHIFCCVLPIALAIISLFAPEFAHNTHIPEWIEPQLFIFSSLMLCLSWGLVMREYKCNCSHCHNTKKHKTQRIILTVITVLFIISVILHILNHH